MVYEKESKNTKQIASFYFAPFSEPISNKSQGLGQRPIHLKFMQKKYKIFNYGLFANQGGKK